MQLEQGLRELLREIIREEVRSAVVDVLQGPGQGPAEPEAPKYLDAAAVAELVGLSREGLKRMRMRGEGPAFHRVGRRAVRYARADVESWLATRKRG